MAPLIEGKIPPAAQPQTGDYSYDLDAALDAVVGLHSMVPANAFTAEVLGTEDVNPGDCPT